MREREEERDAELEREAGVEVVEGVDWLAVSLMMMGSSAKRER